MDEQGYQTVPCPIATMDAFGREFLAACHAEAHERAVQAGLESSPCPYCVGVAMSGICGKGCTGGATRQLARGTESSSIFIADQSLVFVFS